MQILLGTNETIVKINSKDIKIDYIQHFINSNFKNSIIKNNYIFIPESSQHYYHRIFLLKWLYTLYAKRNNNYIPELKESLVNRQHKPIKIVFPKKIIHRITYTVYNKETINIQIHPINSQIAYKLKTFLSAKMTISLTHLSVTLKTKEEKRLLKRFINSENIIDIAHLHIYDKQKMNDFFEGERRVKTLTYRDKAYIILGLTPNDDITALKKRYKKLAKQYHPDKANLGDKKEISLYTRKFQTILQAYETLA